MRNKVFGVFTPFLMIGLMIGVTFIVAAANQSSDGWGALGALIMVFMLTGVLLIVMLIVSIIVYFKSKSDYALGIIYGLSGLFVITVVFGIYNTIINWL
jgi:hypothetical protein